LANAPLDSVLAQWSGLGYYARARHLHRAAQMIWQQYEGNFPEDFEHIIQLPGIGRSTAGAILALAFRKPYPILDGNVKRVLCRVHAIDKPPHEVQNDLWALATQYMPQHHVAEYTQAMMDLGATVCTRTRPNCTQCPLQSRCRARENPCIYPVPKAKKQLPVRQVIFFMLQQRTTGAVLLEQRPSQGIWGGLWSFPESTGFEELPQQCQQLGFSISQYYTWETIRHTFTHFHLDILPVHIMLTEAQAKTIALSGKVWYNPNTPPQLGLAAPVNRLIQQLSPTFAPVQTCLL
jgi:A/G-specific adenine glycosylase